MGRWMMIGALNIKHKTPGLDYYPEDEGTARCWKAEDDPRLWAQAVLLPIKNAEIGARMCMWMASYGYMVRMQAGQEWAVVLYQHPLLELNLSAVWSNPVPLR